ncbi:MAG: matB, partial [Phenylobacterium sp.]|nr:matB [Phenylobacterium sp.]
MNLYDLLAGGFPADRSKPAFLLSDGSAVSYGELEAGVAQVAGHLVARGVEPDDRVAL